MPSLRLPIGCLEQWFYRRVLAILRRVGFNSVGLPDEVLLFKTDRIGDFVLATGALHMLCERFGPGGITMMVSSIVHPLAKREFPLCRILSVNLAGDHFRGGLLSGWWNARRVNSGRRYRHLVSLRHHPTLFEDLLLGSIRAEQTVALDRTVLGEVHWLPRLRSFRAGHTLPYPTDEDACGACLEIEAHRRTVEVAVGRRVSLTDVMPRLRVSLERAGDYLLVAPFSSQAIKDYPLTSLLAALSAARLPTTVPLLVCGETCHADDIAGFVNELRERVPNPVESVHPTDLVAFIDLVGRARLVCSMDSAAAHIATAFDKPGVFLLGGGHFGHFAPWKRSLRQEWLHLRLDCFGCDWKCSQAYVRCIHDISSMEVAAALQRVWTLAGE